MNEPDAPNSISNRDVAKGAGAAMLSRIGGVIEVVSQPLYVWMFGLSGYGLYAVLWAAVNLIENVADLGVTSGLQRVVPQAGTPQRQAAVLRAALLLGVLPSLVLAFLISWHAPWFAGWLNVAPSEEAILVESVQLFAWALPLWAFVEVATSALRARRVFGAEIRLRIFWEQLIRLLLAGGFWAAGFGVRGLLYAHLASLSVTALLSVRLLFIHYDGPALFRRCHAPGLVRGTLLAGLSILPYNIVARLFGDAPPVILNLMLPGASGAQASALYTIARKVSSIIQMIRIAFSYVVSPLASAAEGDRDRKAIASIYGFATRLSIAIALPLSAVIIAGAPAILDLFGPGALAAWPALAILSFARGIEAFGGQAAAIQQVISQYNHPLIGSLVALVLAAAAGWFLVPAFGLTGLALAVGLGLAASALIPIVQLNRHEDLHPFAPPFATTAWRALIVSSAAVGLSWLVLTAPAFLRLAILLPILFAAIWLTLKWALPAQDKQVLGRASRVLRL